MKKVLLVTNIPAPYRVDLFYYLQTHVKQYEFYVMYCAKEADVAIIGCGAYGFPLAAKLKQAGKQAIHLAGATQLLFGIKGKRWEENTAFAYVQKFFNDAWVYPSDEDKPKAADKVEGGCYW